MPQRPLKSSEARAGQLQNEPDRFAVAAKTTQMALFFTDGPAPDGPIIFTNDAALTLTGFTRGAIVGEQIDVALRDTVDPGSLSSIRRAMVGGGEGAWELTCRRADGSEFLAVAFLTPVHDQDGTLRKNCLALVDLGGHIDRLLLQRNELRAVYENAPGFIATSHGPEHRFSFANASYKQFVGREKLEGLTVAEALPELVDQGIIDLLDEVYHTGEPFLGISMPMQLFDPTVGSIRTRYTDFVYQPVKDVNGIVTGLFCEGYDVTLQREASDALAVLQSELVQITRVNTMGTMAATLAHELNQPLSAISNYAAGLRQSGTAALDPALFEQAIQGIEEASQRGAETIRILRDMTRRRAPVRAVFDLKSAVAECVSLVQISTLPETRIINHVPGNIAVTADRIQLQQVVINLLRNACEAVSASDRREVIIDAREDCEMLVVSVTDTGPGVSIEAGVRTAEQYSTTVAAG
ncbi:PAS domain-containing protein [Sphingosinicella sp.]|uniref:sensor histidine kinase n=1 Tax=Sphingosinicella sp. TaxID=1917971 RepID=UPI0017F49F73|nr:PAS domain-containing protein [Sphingosinicella sp.]MBA4759046.1 PAS domain-containing protein [Sphingosinicella sp.]